MIKDLNHPTIQQLIETPLIQELYACLSKLPQDKYLIGGCVRDCLIERPSKDFDIVTSGDAETMAKHLAQYFPQASEVHVFKNFGTAMVRLGEIDIEFVQARKESYRKESRNPEVYAGTLEDDQKRRDFTINTLSISLNTESLGQLIDPFGGLDDLKQGIIRTPLDPGITFSDDPLRILRAIRFACQLNFSIEPSTWQGILDHVSRLEIISKERITDELNKIMQAPKPSIGLHLLFNAGIWPYILPEIQALHGVETLHGISHKDNFFHTLKVVDNVAEKSDNLWLRWAALLHDIAKPPTKRFDAQAGWTFHGHEELGARMVPGIFKRLKLPLDYKMKFVQKLVRLHLRPIALSKEIITDSAVRRLLFEVGDDIHELMQLCEADITSANKNKVARYLQNFELVRQKMKDVEERDRIKNWQPPITGEQIMQEFDLKPCREVGVLKNKIREAILEGLIPNSYQEAYHYLIQEAEKMGFHK